MDGTIARKNVPDELEALVRPHRLLAELFVLKAMSGAGNEAVVKDHLARLALRVSLERLREDWGFLESHGLIKVDHYMNMAVATLTRRGVEVCEDELEVEGVRRPGPECPYRFPS